ncbi:MAG TPA: hypothetical protein IAA01_11260, partial [Candidatus Fournierella excrementavium]|nr:hypothetical protein [Candidatus Fournierella excrementavium]
MKGAAAFSRAAGRAGWRKKKTRPRRTSAGASACRKTCFGNQARAGFLFENKKTGGKSSEMSGAFSRNLDRLP